jgi:large-conductance mechanosensitive channel
VRALESGNYLEAVGPLLLVAFVVFVVFRVMRRRS